MAQSENSSGDQSDAKLLKPSAEVGFVHLYRFALQTDVLRHQRANLFEHAPSRYDILRWRRVVLLQGRYSFLGGDNSSLYGILFVRSVTHGTAIQCNGASRRKAVQCVFRKHWRGNVPRFFRHAGNGPADVQYQLFRGRA